MRGGKSGRGWKDHHEQVSFKIQHWIYVGTVNLERFSLLSSVLELLPHTKWLFGNDGGGSSSSIAGQLDRLDKMFRDATEPARSCDVIGACLPRREDFP